jgi:hypothetical protein
MDKKIVNVIKKDAIVSIEVSGAYYARVYDLVFRLIDRQPDPKKALVNVDTQGISLTVDEAVIQTLMMFMKSVDDVCAEDLENLTVPHTLEIKDKEVKPDEESSTDLSES